MHAKRMKHLNNNKLIHCKLDRLNDKNGVKQALEDILEKEGKITRSA
jgi:hypothetical protein